MSGRLVAAREKVRTDITPSETVVGPAEPAVFTLEITNLDRVIRSLQVEVLGLDPSCVVAEPPILDLFPDERGTVTLIVTLPADHPAGMRTLAAAVLEPRPNAPAPAIAQATLSVQPVPGLAIRTEPTTLEMGGEGTFVLHAENTGNTVLELDLLAQDDERLVAVEFEPARPRLEPGEKAVVDATVRGKRPWVGMPAVRLLEVSADGGGTTALSTLAVVQRPRLGRRLISFLGLLLVITLFAYLIQLSFARVAQLSAANEALVKQGLGFEDDGVGRTAPGGVDGTVLSSTGGGIDGVAVQLFGEQDLLRPVHGTVTGASGVFAFGAVSDGKYYVRAEAAGFGELWYPAAATFEDAELVEVKDGEPVSDLEIVLTGRPGSIVGSVLGADVEDALVEVRLPAESVVGSDVPAVPSVILAVAVDKTGAFVLPDLPAPATYELAVSKEGFATELRTVTLAAGEERRGIDVLLRRGQGRITGLVVDTAGEPIPGVTVVASDGTSEAATRSLSGDADAGTFELRDLATPGTFTATFQAPGFFDETLTLVLDEQQPQREDIVVVMTRADGSIAGAVRSPDGTALGAVTVTVTGAQVERSTQTLSVGAVGTWLIDALPVPGTYTVTFHGSGLTTTAVSVDLATGPEAVRSGVDAVLQSAHGSIRGTVTGTDGVPISGVEITLERAGIERLTITSDEPPGAYVFDALPAGAYTLTYRRAGSTPQTLLVDLDAGERVELEPVKLEQRARITGVVTRNGVGTAGIGVVVHRQAEYPGGLVAEVVTGPGGAFAIEGLDAPDTYVVEFQVPAGGPPVESRTVFLRPDSVVHLVVDL